MYCVIERGEYPKMVFDSGEIYVSCEDCVDEKEVDLENMIDAPSALFTDEMGHDWCHIYKKRTDAASLNYTEDFVLLSELLSQLAFTGYPWWMSDRCTIEEALDRWIPHAYEQALDTCRASQIKTRPAPIKRISWIGSYFNPTRSVYASIRGLLQTTCMQLGVGITIEDISPTTRVQVYPGEAIDMVEWYVRENPSFLSEFRKGVVR